MWDPGGCSAITTTKEDDHLPNRIKLQVTDQIHACISTAQSGIAIDAADGDLAASNRHDPATSQQEYSRTELDSHANMPVAGRNAYVISDTGQTAEVNAFSPDYDALTVKICDVAIQYDCPYTGQTYIFVIRNSLHVPAMNNNLLPPFLIREAGIELHDTPKIQVKDPSVNDHSLYFPSAQVRIPLQLWGIFSYFPSKKPTSQILNDCEDIFMLTPSNWDPHEPAYKLNEESMLDWDGNIVSKEHRHQILLADIDQNEHMVSSATISAVETRLIDKVLESAGTHRIPQTVYPAIPRHADEVSSVLASIDPLLNDQTLYERSKPH